MSTITPASTGRLTADQVEHYHREGYTVFNQPVLPARKFEALKNYFEQILADMPSTERPEAMDVPHFMHPKLLEWALDDSVLSLVTPILGEDLALFSTHFICKPKGNGKRVPWHEDSAYWKGKITPMEVCTVWFAIDPSTKVNGCMMVIPRTHREGQGGFSDYEATDTSKSVFGTEIIQSHRDDSRRVYVELQANECSLHDARIQHGSEPNTSNIRRCGWTLRFCSTKVKFNQEGFDGAHHVYLARGRDLGGNIYADPTRAYPELLARRGMSTAYKNSH
ncbi:MAG: Protein involved in biosynthesis of mitomycin antibiotics/polyketide fumonisin [Rariglobus sp.]|jgi:ectoine hydroxylase-related dioxygenase (phytanoyl-CoA dioxygenase family)|nr:Protein involved in biosynthesis of mitomycin antibiotics/polyketide fumonisin [Rariglobus sp.]